MKLIVASSFTRRVTRMSVEQWNGARAVAEEAVPQGQDPADTLGRCWERLSDGGDGADWPSHRRGGAERPGLNRNERVADLLLPPQ